MADVEKNNADGRDSRLHDAIREVKNAAADRGDVVVDLRDAARGRLELLAAELAPVFQDVPTDDESFDLAISSGLQPRLWIDAVAHVAMGRDRRAYRFVRDTRAGRVVLAEDTEIKAVADAVTRYIAERLVERSRMMDGAVEAAHSMPAPLMSSVAAPVQDAGWSAFLQGLVLVLLGACVGAALLLFVLWEKLVLPGVTS